MSEKDTLILAIESSCDETAASVVKNGRCVLSNIISSQIAIHTLYGGVVPEIASRKHIEKINQVVEAALKEADVTLDDIDAIGVTYGPGLVGAPLGHDLVEHVAVAPPQVVVGEARVVEQFGPADQQAPPLEHRRTRDLQQHQPLLRGEPGAGRHCIAELVELVRDIEQGEHHALLDRSRQPGSPVH